MKTAILPFILLFATWLAVSVIKMWPPNSLDRVTRNAVMPPFRARPRRRGLGGRNHWLPAGTIIFNRLLTLAVCFVVAGCRPASPPEISSPQKPEETSVDREPLRRAFANIQSCLSDLEGRLRISNAQTWSLQAAAAQGDVGNIRSAVGTLKAASRNIGSLESLLSDLEGKLRGATAENWSQNASAAQQIVGSIQIELQNMRRGL